MSSKKVYVGSIPGNLSEDQVLEYFKQIVPNITFSLNRNLSKRTNNSGFGFLTVYSNQDLQTLLGTTHFLQGRQLKCQEYLTGEELEIAKENLKRRRLFVRGFKKGITDQDLRSAFSVYGEVESAYVVKIYSTGELMGYGYVTFKKVEVAEHLLQLGKISIKGTPAHLHPFVKFEQGFNPTPNPHAIGVSRELESHHAAFAFTGFVQTTSSNNFDYTRLKSANLSIQTKASKSDKYAATDFKSTAHSSPQRRVSLENHELPHSTKPTSRSFYRSRCGFGDHSSANIVLNMVSFSRWASKMPFQN